MGSLLLADLGIPGISTSETESVVIKCNIPNLCQFLFIAVVSQSYDIQYWLLTVEIVCVDCIDACLHEGCLVGGTHGLREVGTACPST